MKLKTHLRSSANRLNKLLDQYNVQALVLDRLQDRQLIQLFRKQSTWSLEYEDDSITLFYRTDQTTT